MYVSRGKTHMHTHMYVPQLTKEEAVNLKEIKEGHMGGFREKKGKGFV